LYIKKNRIKRIGFYRKNNLPMGSDLAGTSTTAVSTFSIGFSGLISSSCRDETFN
jgi:hypothetical protein